MLLHDLLTVVYEYNNIIVGDHHTGEMLTQYNGKNSIDPRFNNCRVELVTIANNELIVYVNLTREF